MIREAEMEEMERKWKEQNAAILAAHPQLDGRLDPLTDQNGLVEPSGKGS
jgi:sec-independent protein translocase protein TatB